MSSKNYDSVLKDLDVICGCTRAAKNAEAAIRELIVQRDDLLAALDAMTYYFAQYEKDAAAKYVFAAAHTAIAKSGVTA